MRTFRTPRRSLPVLTMAAAWAAALGGCGGAGEDPESLAARATDPAAAAVCTRYAYTDLGTLGGTNGSAVDINNAGQIVGTSQTAGDAAYHATLWTPAGAAIDLGTLGGTNSSASGINNAGRIVGNSGIAGSNDSHATLWSNGVMTDLGAFGASDINESGRIVGGIGVGFLQTRAVVWDGATLSELSPISGVQWISSAAAAINNAGVVVGTSSTRYFDDHGATSWTGAVPAQLGGFVNSFGYGVNNRGQAVGSTRSHPGSSGEATLWNGTTPTILPGLALNEQGRYEGAALDINNSGQIVGRSATTDCCNWHAVLWTGGAVVDLNSLVDETVAQAGWVLTGAQAINDKGWIVGVAENHQTFQSHAYLLTSSGVPNAKPGEAGRGVVCAPK